MNLVLNDLSAATGLRNEREIVQLLDRIRKIVDMFKAMRVEAVIWKHPRLLQCELTHGWPLIKSINSIKSQALRLQLIILFTKSRPIDIFLAQLYPDHNCKYGVDDVSHTVLPGTHLLDGVLISFPTREPYASALSLEVVFQSRPNSPPGIVSLRNAREPSDVAVYVPTYEPSKKHERGGWGSLMDLNDGDAQKVLANSVQATGAAQRYGAANGRYYAFQPSYGNTFHGYPIARAAIPAEIARKIDAE